MVNSDLCGGMATQVEIPEQFQDNQRYSGTIWVKAGFRDPFWDTGKKFRTVPEILGQLTTV